MGLPIPSPNYHLPWLPCTCVFGWQRCFRSTGSHDQRQSFDACGSLKVLISTSKWFWLPASKPSFFPMVLTGCMGILRLGELPLSWDDGTSGWKGKKERTKGLHLYTTHNNKSLHVEFPRRRIIPSMSQLGDFWVMENTCHLEDPKTSFHQTCATGVPTMAQPKVNCLVTTRAWGHYLAFFHRLRIKNCCDIFLGSWTLHTFGIAVFL